MKLTRLLVDLGKLCANYRYLAAVVPRLAAVVKANGYGLGAVPVVQALCKEGCADFFVATPEEGATLRAANDAIHIYVFCGPYDEQSAQAMAQERLTPVLNDRAQAQRWRPHRRMPAAVHVDTGMNRLGFESNTVEPERFKGLNVCLLLSHLAHADDPTHPANQRQIEQLRAVASKFPGVATSLGGSGAILLGAASDLARAGIALYGGNPLIGRWNPLQTVATLEARVIALRILGRAKPWLWRHLHHRRRKNMRGGTWHRLCGWGATSPTGGRGGLSWHAVARDRAHFHGLDARRCHRSGGCYCARRLGGDLRPYRERRRNRRMGGYDLLRDTRRHRQSRA